MDVKIKVNGEERAASIAPETTLLQLLRESWDLTGAKLGCDVGDCGACTVLLDNIPVNACLVLAGQADGREILTIEGLADNQQFHPLQEVFEELAALQCGFCGPGIILAAKGLLDTNPNPSVHDIKDALSGNLCRCTGYTKIIEAVADTGKRMAKSGNARGA